MADTDLDDTPMDMNVDSHWDDLSSTFLHTEHTQLLTKFEQFFFKLKFDKTKLTLTLVTE